jgi:hypothetical protein
MRRCKRTFWRWVPALWGAASLAFLPLPATSSTTPPPAEQCVACHENLYLLHDTGKWFCMCAKQMSCTCCHGGDTHAETAEEAHAGMVVRPIGEQPTACAQCHPGDASQRIATFATLAGVQTFHIAPTWPASESRIQSLAAPAIPAALAPTRSIWRPVALGVLAAAMIGLAVFAYRCWRSDCLSRQRSP